MEFFFYPPDENQFKERAVGKIVRTIIFDKVKGEVISTFNRKVKKIWVQTCKNNIETDHRIKDLSGDYYEIYSWVTKSDKNFGLPLFKKLINK